MSSFTNTTTTTTQFHAHINKFQPHHLPKTRIPITIRASLQGEENTACRRRIVTTLLATSLALGVLNPATTPMALAQNWGTRSFLKERFFEPGLSPEDAVARIKQTAEGLHSIRDMLESMSWRYVLFYIRLKSAYLRNAMTTLPQGRRSDYVKAANELVDNMAEFDYYVRTPKVYESYLFYEKTLKSIDDVVALLA
ncbi:Oxygen-evolving enhancer protein 3-1 [Morus notabilis]|uniref:Oxygen-evolving enhancer protein 3-1 n=1 Tax=Morus notabilis TaxID=981085 RepID=W9S0C1_9ROSA|nr:photosynthetic NDH subunit of lumenal location 2, chloroplastic [Morus notabilis]XP_024029448.1 photosynthetic NDH subunit of lumenal location 2, chloroplastic [Morus notabilis]EXC20003.1 Oxygen-evolving enhancer protein 3-1 [Morus notabilis]